MSVYSSPSDAAGDAAEVHVTSILERATPDELAGPGQ